MTELKGGHIMNVVFFNLNEETAGGNATEQIPSIVTRTNLSRGMVVGG